MENAKRKRGRPPKRKAKQAVIDRENASRVPTEEEALFPKADLAKFLAERTPSSDEWENMAYPLFERGYNTR